MKNLPPRQPSTLIAVASRLAETLEQENAALDAFDIARATGLVDAKAQALNDMQMLIAERAAARAEANQPTACRDEKAEVERLGRRLMIAAERNKRLLQRALVVQGRIIGMIARAVPRAMAMNASRYGAQGRIHAQDLKQPFALSSRV